MPNGDTFSMKPIMKILREEMNSSEWADPFARNSKFAKYTNDINPNTLAEYNMDALDFLKTFKTNSLDGLLFDPPYSLRQIKEIYDGIGISLTSHQSKYFFSDVKNEIQRIVKPGGKVLSFGWSSNGIGKKRGFKIQRIILIAHGGNHNDTIITIETNNQYNLELVK
jgi:hypothetical protein